MWPFLSDHHPLYRRNMLSTKNLRQANRCPPACSHRPPERSHRLPNRVMTSLPILLLDIVVGHPLNQFLQSTPINQGNYA